MHLRRVGGTITVGAAGALVAGALLAGCTTITLTRLEHCTIQRTQHLGETREEILFCDGDSPAWSPDRAVRLTQECLQEAREVRRDELILAARLHFTPSAPKTEAEMFADCYPTAISTVQGENDLLNDRIKRTEQARARLEHDHAQLEGTLEKALDRPVNAVADAKSTSDSGSDVKHQSALTHVDGDPQSHGNRAQHPAAKAASPVRLAPAPSTGLCATPASAVSPATPCALPNAPTSGAQGTCCH